MDPEYESMFWGSGDGSWETPGPPKAELSIRSDGCDDNDDCVRLPHQLLVTVLVVVLVVVLVTLWEV